MKKIYSVGGWVRDHYLREIHHLDLPEGDRDWVIVGATPEEMLREGFLSVGKDFPVFLHPKTHEEYALARLERKVAPGYHGFEFNTAPTVTLEEDLSRRDLTINAMAMADGQLFDPYGGLDDIRQCRLRHVSLAFKEDPVRILRVARFNARFPDFTVAEETMELMREMVVNGEADALVAERVFQEFRKGLMENRPSLMIDILLQCGLWQRLFGVITITPSLLSRLDDCASHGFTLAERFAVLLGDINDTTFSDRFFDSLRAPTEVTDLVSLAIQTNSQIKNAKRPEDVLNALERCDVLRRPERFISLLKALSTKIELHTDFWLECMHRISTINAGAIAKAQTDKSMIPVAIRQARLEAIKEFMS